jgi:hypothetical protein
MTRQYHIEGEVMVAVVGYDTLLSTGANLGLADNSIEIEIDIRHGDIHTDDWGNEIPAELMAKLGQVFITMTLVHFDPSALGDCVALSLGATSTTPTGLPTDLPDVSVGPYGQLMGRGSFLSSLTPTKANYVRMYLIPARRGQTPTRILACTLTGPPIRIPIGTVRSLVQLKWRAIPYGEFNDDNELISAGTTILDHTADPQLGMILALPENVFVGRT